MAERQTKKRRNFNTKKRGLESKRKRKGKG